MHLTFPTQMFIDYVRVYQREDVISEDSISCDPSSRPTADYITRCALSVCPLLRPPLTLVQPLERIHQPESHDVGPGWIHLPSQLAI